MRRLLPLLAVALLLASCQQQGYPIYRGYKLRPYTVRGVSYTPMSVDEALSYCEEGLASYYEADGARGALGQKLYEGRLYAAHKTLPLPCVVRVTNLDNHRSCEVDVRDRGPFIPGRVIDVSSAAARELGITRRGLGRVRIEVLSVGDGPYRRTR